MRIQNNIPLLAHVPFTASGVDIKSTLPGDSYQSFSGTSMATPSWSGRALMMQSMHPEAHPDQIRGAMRHDGPMALVSGQSELRPREEYLKLDAQDILKEAQTQGCSARQIVERRYPVQDTMPVMFRDDAERDRYFQSRVDRRAEMVEIVKSLEGDPNYTGAKTDWSGEEAVQLSQLEPADKAAFYARLDTLNQAYYGKVIAMLQ